MFSVPSGQRAIRLLPGLGARPGVSVGGDQFHGAYLPHGPSTARPVMRRRHLNPLCSRAQLLHQALVVGLDGVELISLGGEAGDERAETGGKRLPWKLPGAG